MHLVLIFKSNAFGFQRFIKNADFIAKSRYNRKVQLTTKNKPKPSQNPTKKLQNATPNQIPLKTPRVSNVSQEKTRSKNRTRTRHNTTLPNATNHLSPGPHSKSSSTEIRFRTITSVQMRFDDKTLLPVLHEFRAPANP